MELIFFLMEYSYVSVYPHVVWGIIVVVDLYIQQWDELVSTV